MAEALKNRRVYPEGSNKAAGAGTFVLKQGCGELTPERINKHNLIFPEEKRTKLAERERLVSENVALVNKIASKMRSRLPSNITRDDVLSAGFVGLLNAIDQFNPDKGIAFKTYAGFKIRYAIQDELRSLDWCPRLVRENAKRLQKASLKIENKKMRPAEDEEVANEMGLDLTSFYQLLDSVKIIPIIKDDQLKHLFPQFNSRHMSGYDFKSPDAQPTQTLDSTVLKQTMADVIQTLPKNEQLAITLYYYEELALKEIGKVMGVSGSRVCQLHRKALDRLRKSLQ